MAPARWTLFTLVAILSLGPALATGDGFHMDGGGEACGVSVDAAGHGGLADPVLFCVWVNASHGGAGFETYANGTVRAHLAAAVYGLIERWPGPGHATITISGQCAASSTVSWNEVGAAGPATTPELPGAVWWSLRCEGGDVWFPRGECHDLAYDVTVRAEGLQTVDAPPTSGHYAAGSCPR